MLYRVVVDVRFENRCGGACECTTLPDRFAEPIEYGQYCACSEAEASFSAVLSAVPMVVLSGRMASYAGDVARGLLRSWIHSCTCGCAHPPRPNLLRRASARSSGVRHMADARG